MNVFFFFFRVYIDNTSTSSFFSPSTVGSIFHYSVRAMFALKALPPVECFLKALLPDGICEINTTDLGKAPSAAPGYFDNGRTHNTVSQPSCDRMKATIKKKKTSAKLQPRISNF